MSGGHVNVTETTHLWEKKDMGKEERETSEEEGMDKERGKL